MIATASDSAISLSAFNSTEGILALQDQKTDGNRMVIIQFDRSDGGFTRDFSIKIDFYPSNHEISSNQYLNVIGHNSAQNQMLFLRVSIPDLKFIK